MAYGNSRFHKPFWMKGWLGFTRVLLLGAEAGQSNAPPPWSLGDLKPLLVLDPM